VKRVLLSTALLFFAGCVTAPETKPGDSADAGPETPDVPYTPKTVSTPTPEASSGGAEVIKPATGGAAPAAEAPPAAPPPPAFDPQTQSRFKDGVTALAQGNTDAAERAFKDVLDRNDKAAYAWTNLGLIEERRGSTGSAERNYRRALDLDPGQDTAWDYLARLQCRQRKCPQIENELRAAIAKNPALIGPRNALVYTLLAQGKLEPAAAEAKKVLKADERNVRAM
jgi:Flp pilus assembly protein TadD